MAKSEAVLAWAKAVGIVVPADPWFRRVLELAYDDAVIARGLPTSMNARLTRKGA